MNYQPDQELKSTFAKVGQVLRLKENKVVEVRQAKLNENKEQINQSVQIGQSSVTHTEKVPVSYFAKIYEQSLPPQETKLKGKSDASKQSATYHYNELDYAEKIYYVLKTSEIFPYDVEIPDNSSSNKTLPKTIQNALRPEFTCSHDDFLMADTLKEYQNINVGFDWTKENANPQDPNIRDLSNASKLLKNSIIPNFVNMLDDLKILPIDTESLSKAFHQFGINMRYLSHVLVLSQVAHVKELCITEMLARTCKNILNRNMSELILDNKKEFNQLK